MGGKFGCNGVDNGRLKFDHVRVPRESLLNRYSEMAPDGTFTSSIKGKRARFIKVADRLLSGRLCIASMMMALQKSTVLIGIRFASKRLAVGESGLSDTPI